MTTVLPEPVAILNAVRGSPGFDVSFPSRIAFSIHASPYFFATSAMCLWEKNTEARPVPKLGPFEIDHKSAA